VKKLTVITRFYCFWVLYKFSLLNVYFQTHSVTKNYLKIKSYCSLIARVWYF